MPICRYRPESLALSQVDKLRELLEASGMDVDTILTEVEDGWGGDEVDQAAPAEEATPDDSPLEDPTTPVAATHPPEPVTPSHMGVLHHPTTPPPMATPVHPHAASGYPSESGHPSGEGDSYPLDTHSEASSVGSTLRSHELSLGDMGGPSSLPAVATATAAFPTTDEQDAESAPQPTPPSSTAQAAAAGAGALLAFGAGMVEGAQRLWEGQSGESGESPAAAAPANLPADEVAAGVHEAQPEISPPRAAAHEAAGSSQDFLSGHTESHRDLSVSASEPTASASDDAFLVSFPQNGAALSDMEGGAVDEFDLAAAFPSEPPLKPGVGSDSSHFIQSSSAAVMAEQLETSKNGLESEQQATGLSAVESPPAAYDDLFGPATGSRHEKGPFDAAADGEDGWDGWSIEDAEV